MSKQTDKGPCTHCGCGYHYTDNCPAFVKYKDDPAVELMAQWFIMRIKELEKLVDELNNHILETGERE